MSEVNQLSLFGLDLSGFYRRAVLGIDQVLWGDEVGLKAWFCPPVKYHLLDEIDSLADGVPRDSEGSIQIVLPESKILVTRMTLPASAEIFLDEAVMAHVSSHSPFVAEETCWGSKIVERAAGSLEVEIIIVARRTADDAASDVRQALKSLDRPFGLSAYSGKAYIPLRDYQSSGINERYVANLKAFALRLAMGIAGIAFLAAIPVIWSVQTAQQYGELLRETELRSKDIVRVREALVEAQVRVTEAGRFFASHPIYRPWLHRVAAATPDSVYLNRLSIEGDLLTVSGLAVNAADYQAALVETDLFSEVTAPSAFTLDNRANRERFTLTAVLAPEGDQ